MDGNYPKVPKYFLYVLFILGSWLLICLLHFRQPLFQLSGSGVVVILPFSRHASSSAPDDDRLSTPSSSSCDGRYVHMVDLPPQFDVCAEGSPAFNSEHSICPLMSNAGLGPVLTPAGNHSDDGDAGIVPNTGWYNTNQYALEVIFHHRVRLYECLTEDPVAAAAVYVPYYPAMELHPHTCGLFNATVRDGASEQLLRWLSSRPAWAALGGRDHFMVASKTSWMFRREVVDGGDDTGCGNSFLVQPESRNMTVLTYETVIWERPQQDFAVPYPSYFHPSSAGEVAEWQARMRAAPRPWLFAFAGARRPNGTLAIRDRIFDACDAAPPRRSCGKLDCGHGLEGSITCRSPRKLMSLFASSRFCLQPPGDSFMRRSSVDAVMAGCIPVFFHEASTFEQQYRWHERDPDSERNGRSNNDRRYYVFIDQDDVLQGKVNIEEALSRYTDGEVAGMREEVIKMIPRFLYKDPRVRFAGDMRDAFDITIDEVIARISRIKNGENLGRTYYSDGAVIANGS
ncbi:Xyloglucan galactosyltransferase KATAMARI1-like protein [Dichanthelium oligosanthes]|uniref:Xyloglucan galactosyltransferase KATAMARI1-like protein n=1 Tax=Dichanthelium oligosanthes TaxID=888268 RepID=A0A1E5WDZ2_9POAL|nr:Xyloglucan galactosyltransferase KATAMARI1-like protein [Dichanthelium oligosanthes]